MPKILVIEDHDGLREYIVEMLRLKDYEVADATNGVDGLRLALEERPDVILCDIMMEPISGYDVLKDLRSNPATAAISVILVSARSDRESRRFGMSLGADDLITKPFTRSDLLDSISARMSRRNAIYREAEAPLETAKRQLMRMLTHELRTPLVSINMVVDIISRQSSMLEPAELQELLDTLMSGSKRLSRMVEQIVLITQIHAGSLREDVITEQGIPMPLWETLIAAIGMSRKYAYRGSDVDIDLIERDKDALVVCNMGALKHALSELITNAINFSPEGHQVLITQWKTEKNVWISITDQGPGIEPDQLQKALEQFQQISRETQEQQGIGLGLALAHHLIRAHSGNLELTSVKDKGTQVSVSLPLYEASEPVSSDDDTIESDWVDASFH
jgi:signal transduction histidine kinase